MRSSVIAIAALFGSLVVSSAEAMPIPAVGTAASAPIVKVDYACGRGWHLTRWGECRPNRWGPPPRRWGYYRPPPPPPWGWHGHRHHRDGWRDDRWRDRPRYW
ncbi:hypothetical protein FBZ98_10912 [Rhizobium sp. ERR 922]|uniref:GCG_CRPN prefix-to-repeats domain-containing protein n=1 Tax=Rhizobium TaxID=379 RepID=UPI000BA86872|nr:MULTISPECIES: hypothetical protein [Rhizobium]ASW05099.1 hypothetical protein CKA34_03865 [Rhizobium sp. 11515TR]MDK4716797.1 hypothetical protein [Rhizobium sp. CNPSo 4039]TWB16580.1 hypothetical protein FBZ99_103959 [Rhizobium sp. ERR1071]TWB47872.1 hypothetical protein FBZ98_10912 [Rhizobium sp. ERR 922]TWB89481.1 hypothetical protein FBZ97_11012 [Rhizobium sp. ERR 942]